MPGWPRPATDRAEPPRRPGGRRAALQALGLVAVLGLALAHALLVYGSGGRDDVHITYGAADRLAETGRVLNVNGEAVEQSSSLLQVLLLAGLSRSTGAPTPWLGPTLSLALGLAVIAAAWRAARGAGALRSWLVPLLLALCAYFVYWSSSGFESTLAALILLLFASAVARLLRGPAAGAEWAAVAALAAAYVAARPEGALVLLSACGALLALGGLLRGRLAAAGWEPGWGRRAAGVALTVLVAFGLLAAWRQIEFGRVFPQPVYVKSGETHVAAGLAYLRDCLRSAPSLGLLALLAAVRVGSALRRRPEPGDGWMLSAAALVGAQLAFVAAAGGDWMEGGRFLVPILPLLVVLGVAGLDRTGRGARLLVPLLLLTAVVEIAFFAREHSRGIPAWGVDRARAEVEERWESAPLPFTWFEYANRVHLRDTLFVPALDRVVSQLRESGVEPVTVLSGQAGMVPYYVASRHGDGVEFIDLHGLVTRHLGECEALAARGVSRRGLRITYPFLLRNARALERRCGIAPPAVIADLAPRIWRRVMRRYDYRVVRERTGRIGVPLSRDPLDVGQFVAVREELLPLLSEPGRTGGSRAPAAGTREP